MKNSIVRTKTGVSYLYPFIVITSLFFLWWVAICPTSYGIVRSLLFTPGAFARKNYSFTEIWVVP